jgi:Ca2+-binding EF-hand superfamily protein
MGANGTKTNGQMNFNQYGLSQQEAQVLTNEFNKSAGKDHKLDRNEFLKLYLQLNPQSANVNANELANRAFMAADTNHDGFISFDEFIAFYVMNRSQSHNFSNNMSNFLYDHNGNNGFISTDQAYNYANFAYNYHGGPANIPLPGQMMQSLDLYNGRIPVNAFVETVSPFYTPYY